jgi:hypothetical protein
MGASRETPTPALPRKRERERTAPVFSPFPLPLAGEGGAPVRARRVGADAGTLLNANICQVKETYLRKGATP